MLNAKELARKRDQFYTQEIVAKNCLEQLFLLLKKEDFYWIEPSAGTGSFSNLLLRNNLSFSAYDIEPKSTDIEQQDFLQLEKQTILQKTNKPIVIVGNPPFGKNASLAIKFFNKAAQFSQYIAMIVPATFEKQSVKHRLDLSMHLVKSIRLENDLFLFDGKLVPVPTVFQIWEKREAHRIKHNKITTTKYFQFVKKEQADFAIQRVGVAAGKVKQDFMHLAETSHYFLQAPPEVYELFKKISWEKVKYNTAGNPSISKVELIEHLEQMIEHKMK